jgi:hypothetical protein
MTVKVSLLRPFCHGNDDDELRVLAKGVQQIEAQYRFMMPKAKHKPFIAFCVWRVNEDLVIWRELLYNTVTLAAYVSSVRMCIC